MRRESCLSGGGTGDARDDDGQVKQWWPKTRNDGGDVQQRVHGRMEGSEEGRRGPRQILLRSKNTKTNGRRNRGGS